MQAACRLVGTRRQVLAALGDILRRILDMAGTLAHVLNEACQAIADAVHCGNKFAYFVLPARLDAMGQIAASQSLRHADQRLQRLTDHAPLYVVEAAGQRQRQQQRSDKRTVAGGDDSGTNLIGEYGAGYDPVPVRIGGEVSDGIAALAVRERVFRAPGRGVEQRREGGFALSRFDVH